MWSVGAVIDWLVAVRPGDPAVFAGVVVSDGEPTEDLADDEVLVVIADTAETMPANGDEKPDTIRPRGANRSVRERYRLTVRIDAATGDPDGQKAIRDRVLDVFAVYQAALRADPTCGDAVDAAVIDSTALGQTSRADLEENEDYLGRAAVLAFTVSVTNHSS